MCRAAASVELAGVIMMVYPSGFARQPVAVVAHQDVGAGSGREVADRADLARRILLRGDWLRRQHEGDRDKCNPDCGSGRMCHFFPPDWADDPLTGPFLGSAK